LKTAYPKRRSSAAFEGTIGEHSDTGFCSLAIGEMVLRFRPHTTRVPHGDIFYLGFVGAIARKIKLPNQ
jgi:hypothetical protein